MKPHLGKLEQIDSANCVNFKPKFDGKLQIDVILNITSTYVNAWHKNDTSNNSIKLPHAIIQINTIVSSLLAYMVELHGFFQWD